MIQNPLNPEIRQKYLLTAVESLKEEYDVNWDDLPQQTQDWYLTKIIVEELDLTDSWSGPYWYNKRMMEELLKYKHPKPHKILMRWLGVFMGIVVFGILGWLSIKHGMSLFNIPDGNYIVPIPMIQFWGFVLAIGGPLGAGIAGFHVAVVIQTPKKYVRMIKGLFKDLWESKYMVIVCVAGFILIPFIIWWFCVDVTPWKIFIAPGMILALIAGKRR